MPNVLRKPWYSSGKSLFKKVDGWVLLRNPNTGIGQEIDWLGWDGWVLVEYCRVLPELRWSPMPSMVNEDIRA